MTNFILSRDSIENQQFLGEGRDSTTYLSTLSPDNIQCVSKVLKREINNQNEDNLMNYIQILKKTQHPGIIPFIGYIPSDKDGQNQILFKFTNNLSLQHILDSNLQNNQPFLLNKVQKYIIIYGIAQTMKFLHQNNILHERLTPSNILLDENLEPKITDYNLSILYPDIDNFITKSIDKKHYFYIDPEIINNRQKITDKSDIFAFAIISILILFEDKNICQNLLDQIKKGLTPIISQTIPDELNNLLLCCLDHNSNNRPSFKTICNRLDTIIESMPEINIEGFQLYKRKILNINDIDDDSRDQAIDYNEIDYNTEDNPKKLFQYIDQNNNYLLADDPFFDKTENDFGELLNGIDDALKKEEDFNFDAKIIEEQNFILTNKSKENLIKLYKYIQVGVPVLLEGQTGTAKTFSSEIACKLAGYDTDLNNLIRFNLSSETRIQDLFGRYIGDDNSWSGISYQDGPFTKAFTDGLALLLDEINLAPASVLQCIEEALDSGYLSVEIAGKPLKKKVKMNPKFRLIATQNPNKGSYANKRQNLGQKFYSRFQVINFPPFTEDELLSIARGLSAKFKYDNDDVITELVSFHKTWCDNPAISDDLQCFTIREIAATVKALSDNQSAYHTIMTIYGARYEKETKLKLKNLLKQYKNLCKKGNFECPQIDGCYMNKSLKSVLKSTWFSLKNGRNVILTGKKGYGKTQIAIWISELYNKLNKIENNDKQCFFCFCSEEIRVSDLIGHQAPSGKSDGTTELIQWQDGFLIKAIKSGGCAVLESLDEAPSTVTERMNGLLDQKYDGIKERFFETPENPKNPKVKIKDSFRIIATSDIDNLQQMSPAFLNRFDIIVLENQIDDNMTEEQFHELLTTLMNKYSSNISLVTKKEEKSNKIEISKFLSKYQNMIQIMGDEEEEEEEAKAEENDNENEEKTINRNDQLHSTKFEYSQFMIQLIYDKIKDNKDISYVSKLCNSIVKISSVFHDCDKDITDEQIVSFVFNLLQNNKQFNVPEKIEEIFLNMFQPIEYNIDDPFFYESSPCLRSFMAKLAAYSIIQQPVCITGPTGIGKTSAARAFALLRNQSEDHNQGFRMHSFHSGTKVSHFFGTTTLQDGKIVFHKGTLTEALELGLVFIADEFNLSSQSVMKSLSLALDPTMNKDIFIPGIGESIKIHQNFHFIACQNEIGTLGRNSIPDSIKPRFIEIDYPKSEKEDIQNICFSILKNNYPKFVQSNESIIDEDYIEIFARNTANYMMKINDNDLRRTTNLLYVPIWSLRDITKLFRRVFSNDNYQNLHNIDPIHHVLFYTMSSIPSKYEEKVLNEIKLIIKQAYNLDNNKIKEYIDCYIAEPIITPFENDDFYIMKGNSGVKFNKSKQFIDKKLPSLFNAIFKVYLSDMKEPILITGNSGFKTFLSQLFLPKTQIISLNQETKVAQLLGSSAFMKDKEAKFFYIDNICKILNSQLKSNGFKKDWENENLTPSYFQDFVSEGKGKTPHTFYYALDHLSNKLFQQKDDEDCILLDTTLEFRPGIILNAILQGQSLILKDISNLPTVVLERFNELLSGKQSITLLEDIHDTFTSPNSKELTNFNNSFRVFATCSESSISKLSEAALSRFTVISVPEYSQSEQEIALKSYVQFNNLLFDHTDITALNQFTFMDLSSIKLNLTFPILIKVVEIASKLNQQNHNESKFNIGLTIYRVLGGILGSNKNKQALLDKINPYFNRLNIYNYDKEECQLYYEKNNGLRSKISKLSIKCPLTQICSTQIAFTNSFNDLLDIIHMGLVIHNPILIEGPPGQGKHTAINFIAKTLKIEIERIVISQSTKVEDLFGKEMLISKEDGIHVEMTEPQFIKIIKSTEIVDKRHLILLENLNSGSQGLLDALVPVFDTHSTSILLPNGNIIQKGIFDIIGIFNTQQASSSKDKLPSSLINSAIYSVVPKTEKAEILSIILTKFSFAGLSQTESVNFYNNYVKAKEIAIEEGYSSELFTLNDIDKYILFRTLTKEIFDPKTITQMIFVYRFSSDKIIKKISKSLELEKMKFRPIFIYDNPKTSLFISLFKDDEKRLKENTISDNNKEFKVKNRILLPLFKHFKETTQISDIQSLTLSQKHCLIFLALSVLAKRSCVIQGDTASGKSYLIRLFAKLVGAKLHIYQMNSDCNLSMIAGQSVLNDFLSKEDKNRFRKVFNDLNSIDSDFNILESNNIDINQDSTWTPEAIRNLLIFLQNKIPYIDNKYVPEIKKSIQVIKQIMSPVNRFKHNESTFIDAIRKGEWILIDGIESAPSVIAEKISSLCGDNPELNLYEYGPEYIFSKNEKAQPKNKINDDFHLFITYNPNSLKESQMIDQTFLAKSLTFTLPPFDDSIENSSQMLLGSFLNINNQQKLSEELAARFASMHKYAKIQSQNNPQNFAGDIQFNGRTLKNITKAFSLLKNDENILVPICFSITSFYTNSFIDEQKSKDFLSNCLQKFKESPTDELKNLLQSNDIDPRNRNHGILLVLRNIQKCVLGLVDHYDFNFNDFIEDCSHAAFCDLNYILNHINMTTSLIKLHSTQNNNYLIKYGSLFSINSLIGSIIFPNYDIPIKKEHIFLSINDQDLKNNLSIRTFILQYNLLQELSNNNLFSEYSSILLENQTLIDLLTKIFFISMRENKESFVELFNLIEKDNLLIHYVVKLFPFLKFKLSSISMICYWIPLSQILIEKGIRFSYTIDSKTFNFNSSSQSSFSLDFIMNEKDSFSLSKKSAIHYKNNKKHFRVNDSNREIDFLYYTIAYELSKNPKQNVDIKRMNEVMQAASKILEKNIIENSFSNSMLSLRDLFIEPNYSLICLIWNIIYTLPNTIVHQLSEIINTAESKLLLSTLNLFESFTYNTNSDNDKIEQDIINIEDLIEWSEWAKKFDEKTKILKKIIIDCDFDFEKNVNEMIKEIEDEISYLKDLPTKLKRFWPSDKLIKLYESSLIQYKQVQEKREFQTKESIIKREIGTLQQYLINTQIIDSYKKMKADIIDQLSQITEFTEESLNSAKYIVKTFISDSNSDKEEDNSFINWPQVNIQDNTQSTVSENIKLLEAIIWYSQINSILNELKEKENVINNLRVLNDFSEMAFPREVFIRSLILNSNANQIDFTNKDIESAYHTLNAHMILKLYNINILFLKEPFRIHDIFNNYMNRSYNDEREIGWVYETSTTLPNNLILSIPIFKPKDLIFLIVNKKLKSEIRPGPLFNGVQNQTLLKNIKSLSHQEFISFIDTAKSIGCIVYQTILKKTPPSEYEDLKKAFMDDNQFEGNEIILNGILQLFKIADDFSEFNFDGHELKFDDITFLSKWNNNKWIDDDQLLNNFPSLVFWICKNNNCIDQIANIYGSYMPKQNEIPFWLLSLRIMSSIECIYFDTESHSSIAIIMNQIISGKIRDFVEKSKKEANENQKPLNYDWINILISNVPPKFFNSSIKLIHDFLINLACDEKALQFDSDIEISLFFESISELIESLLSNQEQNLMTNNILDQNTIAYFLAFPSKFINEKIITKIYKTYEVISTNQLILQLKEQISSDYFLQMIYELQKIIIEEEREMANIVQQKTQELIHLKLEKTKEYINSYNNIIYELINNKLDDGKLNYKNISSYVYKLHDFKKKLDVYHEIFKEECLCLEKLVYSTSKEGEKIIIFKKTKENGEEIVYKISITLPNTNKIPKTHHLFPDERLDKSKISKDIDINSEQVKFPYILDQYSSNNNDLIQIITKHQSSETPLLVFGETKQTSEEFISSLNNLQKEISLLDKKFFKIIESQHLFSLEDFDFMTKISIIINDTLKRLRVTFSDGSPSSNSNAFIQEKIKDFLNDMLSIINEVRIFIHKNLIPILKVLYQNHEMFKNFNNHYDIHIPIFDSPPKSFPDFTSIRNINSLSSPIISISQEKQIICTVDELKCQIGPIFSSQISKPYKIHIISFINEEVICKIVELSDPQYSKLLTTKEKIQKSEPIQIFIMPPLISSNKPKTFIMEGKISISTKSIKPFNLPFKFKLNVVPLKVRLRCIEFDLAEEKMKDIKCLRLCCEQVESGSLINFEMIDYYIHDHFLASVDLESLAENEADKPEFEIHSNEQRILLRFPKVITPKRCKFLIKIALSQSFLLHIHCDVHIVPLVFSFEYFDYESKKYVDSICPVTFYRGISQKIYFRIQTMLSSKRKGKFIFDLPHSIKIESDINLQDQIEFSDELIISLSMHIDSTKKMQNKSNKIIFDLGIGYKCILFDFVEPPNFPIYKICLNQYSNQNDLILNKYPCYSYQESRCNWNRITSYKDLTRLDQEGLPFIVVSPYHIFHNKNVHKIKFVEYQSDYYIDVEPRNAIFIQLTIPNKKQPISLDSKQFCQTKIRYKYIPYSVYQVYYSILGYIDKIPDYWFPAYDVYPNTTNIQFLPYDNNDENIIIANSNIQSMFYDVCPSFSTSESKSIDIRSLSNRFTNDIDFPVARTNFAIFMVLLINENVILNINSIINKLPNIIQKQFTDILEDINKIVKKDSQKIENGILTIISHNLIVKFAQIFSAKYNEIYSRKYILELPLSYEKIFEKQKLAYNEFFSFNLNQTHEKSVYIKIKSHEIKSKLKNITLSKIPKQNEKCFIIEKQENSRELLQIPCNESDNLGEYAESNPEDEKSTNSDNVDAITYLPPIAKPENLSIQFLNEFYSSCSRGASILPVYVKYQIIKKKDLKDAELYYATLYNIFWDISKSKEGDKSIISSNVNHFKESFKNCIRRFQRAGLYNKSMSFPYGNSNQNHIQDYIISPPIVYPNIRHIPWKTKYQSSNNYTKSINYKYKKGKFQLKNNNFNNKDNLFNILKQKQNNPKPPSSQIPIEISSETKKLIIGQVVGNDINGDEKNIPNDLNSSIQPKRSTKPKLKIDPNSQKTVLINPQNIDGIFIDFNEVDSIKLVIRRIKEKNEMLKIDNNLQLKFSNIAESIIQNQNDLFQPNVANIDILPITDLVDNSQFLIANLISKVSDINCPFLYMYCNLLIDISSFISIENKLYSFMLLISFSYALTDLEIPFSISIVADQKFRYVLKPFEEDLTNMIIQRIFDCIFIKRFKTNIADSVHYALEYMKYPSENRTQRSIFLFSNGIDENFVLAESWKELLLNDSNNSFGFIFIKSENINIEDNAIIENMWKEFNRIVEKAPSFTILTYIDSNLADETVESISLTFQKVLYRSQNNSNNIFANKIDIKPKFPEEIKELTKEGFEIIEMDTNFDFDDDTSSFFKQSNKEFNSIATKFQKFDDGYYSNKICSIVKSNLDSLIKDRYAQFIHKIVFSKRYSFRPYLEAIFRPNKASQTVLSSTGTEFDITALVLNLINPVPDPLIYLEEKGGQIRNYGISIIIDSSRSCFSQLSSSHSYQTILILFAALSSIDIPCIDVIIATNSDPIVLCSEIQSYKLLSEKSSFWTSLLSCLFEANYDKCDLESAIHAAYDLRRMRSFDSTCYMFVLTDGIYQSDQKQLIKNHLFACFQSGFSIFGIGIGIYPKGIVDMFPQTLFATNPNDLIKGIASFFGDISIETSDDYIKHLSPEKPQFNTIKNIFEKLYQTKDKPIFIDLQKYLSNTQHALDAFSQIYNEEIEATNSSNELINPEGLNTELYVKDLLKGQKILFVMLYKDQCIDPNFISNPPHAGETCVKDAFDYFGIELVLVFNYKSAIDELTKQTIPEKCDYYAVWVISGSSPTQVLPDGGDPGYVGQFIDCIIQFWNNGGSVVMFADNSPYTFQANLFLERLVFPDGNSTKLRVHGFHEGRKHLAGDPSGNLSMPQTFNKSPLIFDRFHRSSIAHNLVDIYEGVTLSYGPNEPDLYSPFTPFMRDSDGGISTYFYSGDRHAYKITGDIILDCGFTKLFDQMTTSGTYRYIQNIAGWTAQCESRYCMGINPKDFRPKAVIFTINEKEKFQTSQYNPEKY